MRSTILPILALLAGAGLSPAAAQSFDSSNSLNTSNDRMATQGELRGMRQQQQFDTNQTRMQIQRNELFRPAPTGPGVSPPRR